MPLEKFLADQGYDLIEGPIRTAEILQLWLKKPMNKIEKYSSNITDRFISPVELKITEEKALKVNSELKNTFSFNIGASILDDLLDNLGLGEFDLSTKISSGKSVAISYDNALTKELTRGDLELFLENADFKHKSKSFLRHLNKNDIIAISGVMYARHLISDIETEKDMAIGLEAELNEVVSGKIKFTRSSDRKIKMIAEQDAEFPIAVKAHRIIFNNGKFKKIRIISDNRDLF